MLPRETSNSPLQPDVSTVDKAARKIDRNSGILSDRSLFWSIFIHPFSFSLHMIVYFHNIVYTCSFPFGSVKYVVLFCF